MNITNRIRYAPRIFAIALFAIIQLFVIMHTTKIAESFIAPENDSFSIMPLQSMNEDTTKKKECFPRGHHNHNLRLQQHQNNHENNITIIYLETAYVNMHYETYYSFINEICSCNKEKDPYWTINTKTIPHFYIGPLDMLTPSFEQILTEYNTTTSCGPIHFGTPPPQNNNNPHLTIVTTSYPNDFEPDHERQYHKLINDTRYIFICHEDAPTSLEVSAMNVFFLTPLHKRYIVPSFFPPTIVQRHSKSIRQQAQQLLQQQQQQQHGPANSTTTATKSPIFLVIGSFNNRYRRNVDSLIYPVSAHRDKNFTIRFLGGGSSDASNDALAALLRNKFPKVDYDAKIQLLPRTDSREFMMRVGESDVILPLVDEGSFYHPKGYQGGRKLTSSVMWGLGFGKKMLLYRPLAEVFGIVEDNVTFFLHGESSARVQAVYEGFGRCLDYILEHE
mmetsp:Transcript_5700/g.12354  ORF Transcript_5700/g.12354 Transcript_5700/m.12354 type:complete len:447 (-) Transcript_5700:217-1557(-)